jgi:ADP-heptose:LPS heptosyltransferase
MPLTLDRIRESALPRHVDRALGAPLLWLMGALRTQRSMPRDVTRVGIMMFETLGDTLLAGTIIASLRATLPQLDVTVFASRGNLGVLPLMQGIDRVVEVPLLRPFAAVRAMRSVEVDVMIDIGQWPRWYAMLCALSRSRCTIGFATPGQGRHYAFDCAVPHRRDVHEAENFQSLIASFPGIVRVPPARALRRPGALPPGFAHHVPYIVCHPWPGGFNASAREWPQAYWIELFERLNASGYSVLISGGPADAERAAALVAQCPGDSRVRSVAGECSLAELAAILAHASAAVCVNTGIMHLASLLDVPLVALHGPTSRRRWGPLGERAVALAPAAGAGVTNDCEFLNLGFEYPEQPVDCMRRIGVDEVFAACRRLLQNDLQHENERRHEQVAFR